MGPTFQRVIARLSYKQNTVHLIQRSSAILIFFPSLLDLGAVVEFGAAVRLVLSLDLLRHDDEPEAKEELDTADCIR